MGISLTVYGGSFFPFCFWCFIDAGRLHGATQCCEDPRTGSSLMDHPGKSFLAQLEEDMMKLVVKHGMLVSHWFSALVGAVLVPTPVVMNYKKSWFSNLGALHIQGGGAFNPAVHSRQGLRCDALLHTPRRWGSEAQGPGRTRSVQLKISCKCTHLTGCLFINLYNDY